MTTPNTFAPIEDQEPSESPAATPPAGATRGPLLDLEPEEAAKEAERLWKLNPWFHKRHAGECKQHEMWRKGDRFVKLFADRDQGTVRISSPVGLDALPPTPNKVEEQVRNVVSTIMSDPPKPECEPSDDTPQARDAAQFATRFLTAMGGESALNMDWVMFGALDMAATYRSSFIEIEHDAQGGGYVPLTLQARPSATSTKDAETGAMPDGSMDTRPWVTRYVLEDDTLSETPKGAKMTWQSGLRANLLTSNQVRFLSRLARNLTEAHGVVVARFRTLGDMKRLYADVEAMSDEEIEDIVRWQVADYKRLLPSEHDYERPKSGGKTDKGAPDDETLVCELKVQYKSCLAYPKGCDVVFLGGKYRVKDEVLYFENDAGMPETMDIPLAQMAWELDADGGNCYGETIVRRLGPLDEMRTTLYTSGLEYMHRFGRPRWFLPQGTTIQQEDLADDTKPIMYNPAGKPEFMQLPAYPQMGSEYMDRIDRDMDGISGISGPALGQVAGSVRSADQTNTLIERATITVTSTRENAKDAYERSHRLILQAARRYFTEAQLVSYRGDDGAYQVREFTRADFGSTKQVHVQRGTMTMMTPQAKNDAINTELQAGGLQPDEAARLRREHIAGIIGLEDNPHLLRAKRQLGVWRAGPTPELKQQQAQFAQQQAMQPPPPPQMPPQGPPEAPMMGGQQPAAPPPSPPPPDPITAAAGQVFPVLPVDQEQQVALIRHQEFSRAVAEIEFYNHPPPWTQALLAAYEQSRRAAGIATVQEQQQAQQQQVQQQQQMEQQKQQVDMQEKDKERQFKFALEQSKSDAQNQREAQGQAARATAGVP